MELVDTQPAIDRVTYLAERYFSGGGDYLGQWVKPGRGWSRYFGDTVPSDSISRSDVFDLIKSSSDITDWKKVFLYSMAWGHGSGYGAYRTNRVVHHIGDVHAWMSRLHAEAKYGPKEGYQWLIDNRVKGLGPAFATKLLYFVSPGNNRSPIVDALVANWLSRNKVSTNQLEIRARSFELDQYERYLAFVDKALGHIRSIFPDKVEVKDRGFVEYLVFQDELLTRGKRQRIAPWLSNSL